MLQELFMNVIAMSLTSIPIIIVAMITRIFLQSTPKMFSYILWSVVLFRLICSFSFESNFSFVPEKLASGEFIETYAESYIRDVKNHEYCIAESEFNYILLHEKYHSKRLDYWIKGVAFTVLCIHWFNPFVWVAFAFATADMEMSCDEAVLKKVVENAKADYSNSLLRFAYRIHRKKLL